MSLFKHLYQQGVGTKHFPTHRRIRIYIFSIQPRPNALNLSFVKRKLLIPNWNCASQLRREVDCAGVLGYKFRSVIINVCAICVPKRIHSARNKPYHYYFSRRTASARGKIIKIRHETVYMYLCEWVRSIVAVSIEKKSDMYSYVG